jgi:hypothetical protein
VKADTLAAPSSTAAIPGGSPRRLAWASKCGIVDRLRAPSIRARAGRTGGPYWKAA